MTFALCMIVKNEEQVIARCLESVKGVFDEIIITDTGSVDSTKDISSFYTDKIYDFAWCDDFAAARNFSFSKATSDYIMWLDADDVLSEKDRDSLIKLKSSLSPETNVVMMKYVTGFDSSGNASFVYYRERLIKRLSGLMWSGFVHEVITPRGRVEYSNIEIHHKLAGISGKDPTRNLRLYEANIAKGAKLSSRETYYYARELYYNGRNELAEKYFKEFLSFESGWYADKIGACIMLYSILKKRRPLSAGEYLAKALSYDRVSPQVLCLMGDSKLESGNVEQAAFWYKAAINAPREYAKDGFVMPEYERYYPYLQLCVCYDRLGNIKKAEKYNELAAKEKPESPQVKHNREYFIAKKEQV